MRITITFETESPEDYDSLSVDLEKLVAYARNERNRRYTRIRLTESLHPGVPTLREFIGESDD